MVRNYSVQSVPLIATTPMYQSLIQVQQPQPQIVRQRPIHVVDLEQYDDIWRKKVEDLEKQLRELQKQKPQPVIQAPEPVLELRAGADTEDLERQISQLQLELYKTKEDYEDLLQKYNDNLSELEKLKCNIQNNVIQEQLKNHVCTDNTAELKKKIEQQDKEIERLKALLASQVPVANDDSEQLKLYLKRISDLESQLQDSILQMERYRQENSQLLSQLNFFKDQVHEKDEKIKELEGQIEELNNEMDGMQDEQEEIIEQRVETVRKELKSWKDKFLALNAQFHDQQEKLMLTEAELDHIKKQGGAGTKGSQVITTTTTTKQSK
ncbi:unnamed protein product (macronuclear) [Paramecium tetraurelia]|uniref:Uncharacterized protein n=1 Tax=Paramecium tetraurelia TaxID=5888 RepID=A0DYD4_PARTE|nr:uncharacterized protein GSPATT00003019001 [Paramecium tetraurelia]CAK88051.1 unnamed protein product [Paramecium tetraurelia]|eukprot:XP_001455448.1 hypothetical protein (macronuclear) [Paramecium tetraurelia strain d4-2]